jgi:imidazolonepropionase-like amidohydrolase
MAGCLITNVRVFDGTSAPRADGATVIDGGGGTLMPGLVESHAHIGLADMTPDELTRLPPEEHMLITVRNAKLMLDCGYTSAFSAAAPKPRLDVVLKREIEAGRVPGPRLLARSRSFRIAARCA